MMAMFGIIFFVPPPPDPSSFPPPTGLLTSPTELPHVLFSVVRNLYFLPICKRNSFGYKRSPPFSRSSPSLSPPGVFSVVFFFVFRPPPAKPLDVLHRTYPSSPVTHSPWIELDFFDDRNLIGLSLELPFFFFFSPIVSLSSSS